MRCALSLGRACRHIASKVITARILRLLGNGPLLVVGPANIGRRLGFLSSLRIGRTTWPARGGQARMLVLAGLRLLWVRGVRHRIGLWFRRSRCLLWIVVARGSIWRRRRSLLRRISSRRRRLLVYLLRRPLLALGRARPGARILIGGRALCLPATGRWVAVGARHLEKSPRNIGSDLSPSNRESSALNPVPRRPA